MIIPLKQDKNHPLIYVQSGRLHSMVFLHQQKDRGLIHMFFRIIQGQKRCAYQQCDPDIRIPQQSFMQQSHRKNRSNSRFDEKCDGPRACIREFDGRKVKEIT